MALLRIDHVPESIKMSTPLNLIIPEPGEMKGLPVRERKVLYLLHGLSDDTSAWARYSMIEIYARKYGLVVVMPSVGRSFYTDQPNGQKYFTYLVEELPRYLDEVFGIPRARENTLIAGLSMGGYGAMKAALLYPERYFAAASFSGVLSLNVAILPPPDDPMRKEFEWLFGDAADIPGSVHDPLVWLRDLTQRKTDIPKLYISCGLQDDLYPLNIMFREACAKMNIPLEYHETEGGHEWRLWDSEIQNFMNFALNPESNEV